MDFQRLFSRQIYLEHSNRSESYNHTYDMQFKRTLHVFIATLLAAISMSDVVSALPTTTTTNDVSVYLALVCAKLIVFYLVRRMFLAWSERLKVYVK